MDYETFGLFDDSNFDAYDRERFAPVLREGLVEHGLSVADVVLVHQDMGMWVFCRTGLFRADILGMFKKRTEIGPFIPAAQLGGMAVEPTSPHALRLVVTDRSGKKVAKISFSPAGPSREVQTEKDRCNRVYDTMLRAWGEAPRESTAGCPCGQGPASVSHLRQHIVEVTTASGIAALTYDCPACGLGAELWRDDEEGRGGAPAGLAVHLMTEHAIRG